MNKPHGYMRKVISTEICRDRSLPTPEGRPYGRTISELLEISDEETAVVSLLAGDTDTIRASRVQLSTGDE